MTRKIGNNILNIIKEKEISIRKLSKDLQFDYKTAHNLCNRKSLGTTQLRTVVKVAEYLDVNLYDLF